MDDTTFCLHTNGEKEGNAMRYIDLHCDTLMRAWLYRKRDIYKFPRAMTDVQRLLQGNCLVQFFAIFMLPVSMKRFMGPFFPDDRRYIEACFEIFHRTVREHSDEIAVAMSYEDICMNRGANKLSGMLTLEDGRAVDGDLEKLEQFYAQGVRLISLTWNAPNCFGFPNSANPQDMRLGLTSFGKEAVDCMNKLGMLVDVSHLSDGGFWDVAALSKKPFVASHSNCRSLAPHPRNLTDEMIRAVAQSGGVIGLNFGPEFLTADAKNKVSTAQQIALHACHLAKHGGIECVALGTDFDGIGGQLEIHGPQQMELLFDALRKQGFSEDAVEQIACKNVLRVIRDVL